ncbi:hypothetical protein Nepgr_006611 [Nepenthes gracilis]|uniref:Uncharacterized protein n=1 Tax=Nepenthes gracilis TaxID=150966 RepID=A0AAD3XHS0_NEPGR|nr:hypothetical protein Nepgr_006611 [Nepenthes gracilis]
MELPLLGAWTNGQCLGVDCSCSCAGPPGLLPCGVLLWIAAPAVFCPKLAVPAGVRCCIISSDRCCGSTDPPGVLGCEPLH